jgi:SAM-dependent methyltransferase
MTANPFLDPARRRELYGQPDRLANRSGALLRARISGAPVLQTIARLATAHRGSDTLFGFVADIGCGRGTSSRILAEQLKPTRLLGLDAVPALLADARRRTGRAPEVTFLTCDFHRLPLRDNSCDLAVAAFCLYHSPRPERVIAEIRRTLIPGGLAVLVTKSLDSYREMDALVAAASLDPGAEQRESLYTSAHSGNLADLARTCLDIVEVRHERHTFRFDGHHHAAAYLATNPKYHLAPGLYADPHAIAAALRKSLPDQPVTTSSVVTYVTGRAQGGYA